MGFSFRILKPVNWLIILLRFTRRFMARIKLVELEAMTKLSGVIPAHCSLMIDTVVLSIDKFDIDEKHLIGLDFRKSGRITRYAFNPEIEGVYMPNLTIKKVKGEYGNFTDGIDIQFSAPKLIRESNYFGVDELDYDNVINTLISKLGLKQNNLPITKTLIENASVKSIAFSFNFILPSNFGYPAEFLSKVVAFLDIGKKYNNAINTYYNQSNRFGFNGSIYNRQIGFRVYDKAAEIIANAKNYTEIQIAEKLKIGVLPDKILRMEITFQHRFTLKRFLGRRIDGNVGKERNLREMFNNGLCQGVLLEFFDKLANDLHVAAMDTPLFPIADYMARAKKSGRSLKEAYIWFGYCATIQQAGSYQQKLIEDENYSRQERYRFEQKLKNKLVAYKLSSFTIKQVFDECRKQLFAFKIIKTQGP